MNTLFVFTDSELCERTPLGQAACSIAQAGVADVDICHTRFALGTPMLYPIHRRG